MGQTILSESEARLEKHIREVTLLDNDFMKIVFYDNIPVAQYILRIILDKEDLIVTEMVGQLDLPNLRGKSSCLDVRAKDSYGKIYNIEVQRKDNVGLPKRARYYSSLIDVRQIKASEEYDKLPETYVIFITEKDIFNDGASLHHFERNELSTKIALKDGTHILFVNGAYTGNDSIGRLMHDFRSADPNDMYSTLLAKETRYHKEDKEGRREVMTFYELGKDDGIAEGKAVGIAEGKAVGIAEGKAVGIAEGKAQERLEAIKRMLSKLSVDDILSMGYTKDEIAQAQAAD